MSRRQQRAGGVYLPWLAADADVVPQLLALVARQHEPHARITRIGRVVVATPPAVALGRLSEAERCSGQRARGRDVRHVDLRRSSGLVERESEPPVDRIEDCSRGVKRRGRQTVIEGGGPVGREREVLDGQARDAVEQRADERASHDIGVGERIRHGEAAGGIDDAVALHS